MHRLAALTVCFLSATASACADNANVDGPVILGGGLSNAAQMCVPGTVEIEGGGFTVDRCAMSSEPKTTYVEDGVTRLRWDVRGGITNITVATCSCVAQN